ncbi:SufE family protein [Anaerotruncus rubiinfantis]|uniref:SufE family protein n=1 Tax=Anaerotruncus rubiinfantis TaxID=1720200 RepID=UPI0034A3FF0D
MSLINDEAKFINDFNALEDRLLQYEYLIRMSTEMPPLHEGEKNDASLFNECRAKTWLVTDVVDGCVLIRGDSESFIVKGILSVTAMLLNKRSATELCGYIPAFIEQTAIKRQLSAERLDGISKMVYSIIQKAETALEPVGGQTGKLSERGAFQ